MNGAELLIRALRSAGVEIVFGYPGGAIMPIYDALIGSGLRHILTRHEQGAALAADGYARATGKIGVCMATSGPGATNLITGIANAWLDSIPMLAITGQVARPFLGTDAFQEVDIFGITLPIVKHSFLLRDVHSLAETVFAALHIAQSGRPGPVLLDIPKDVATALVDITDVSAHTPYALSDSAVGAAEADVAAALGLLCEAKRPLLYLGGGVGIAQAVPALRRFVEVTGIPAVSTLKGLGVLPTRHPGLLGMLGMHGSRAANLAVQACDLLVVVGARFDDRATGALQHFAPQAKVIHLDIDPAEISKRREAHVGLVGDMRATLSALTAVGSQLDITAWQTQCRAVSERFAPVPKSLDERIVVPWFLHELNRLAPHNAVITTDVGQHQMWAAQYCVVNTPEQFLTSGGLGTMGYGLPAALGAQLGKPEACVIALSGDGSIMMNIQELCTMRRYGLPVKIIVFDNRALGMVRQWQELFFEERYSETDLSDNPDFVALAQACGVAGGDVRDPRDVPAAITRMLEHKGPYLLHVHLDPTDKVWPLVPPGASNTQMLEP